MNLLMFGFNIIVWNSSCSWIKHPIVFHVVGQSYKIINTSKLKWSNIESLLVYLALLFFVYTDYITSKYWFYSRSDTVYRILLSKFINNRFMPWCFIFRDKTGQKYRVLVREYTDAWHLYPYLEPILNVHQVAWHLLSSFDISSKNRLPSISWPFTSRCISSGSFLTVPSTT